jgi:hypothetical protein
MAEAGPPSSNLASNSNAAKKAGRPPHPVNKFFTDVPGSFSKTQKRGSKTCNYCSLNIDKPKPPAMFAHLKVCSSCGPLVKEEARLMQAKNVPGEDEEELSDDEVTIVTGGSASNKAARTQRSASPRGQLNISTFMDRPLSAAEQAISEQCVLKFVIHAGLAFSIVDNPYILELMHSLRRWMRGLG